MTIRVEASDRLVAAADDWAEARMEEREEALRVKAEQALLEVEHLVSQTHEVEFEVDGRTIRYEPSEELSALLARQSEELGADESAVLKAHVDIYANAFLDQVSDEQRPPGTPSTE